MDLSVAFFFSCMSNTARTPSYPEEWKNQFGIPVEEHQKSMQVNIFEGYAVFDGVYCGGFVYDSF